MAGFVSLGVSFVSLVISCAALYWSRMARIEAAEAVKRSRYALESSRKHVGLPYDHKEVLMVSQVPLFLVIAESLLAFQASSYPELAGPDDADTEISAGDVDKIGSSASLAFFDDLLSYERAVEDDLAYRRQTVGVPFGYDLILESDEYMNVVCREAALIADRKSGHVGIVLGRPFVDSLVAAGTQRSLADQVRVFTYLVRISCKLVGSRGGVTGFGGDAVCFFRMIVGILRRLVRIVRLEIRDEADDYRNEKRQC